MDQQLNMQPCKAKGFSLIELLVVLAILAAASIAATELAVRQQDESFAQTSGQHLSQIINGIRSRISQEPGLAGGTYSGIAWLQDTSCGGSAPTNYVPCFMNSSPGLNLTYSTNVVNNGPNDLTATVTLGPVTINGTVRPDLAGVIATTANAVNQNWHAPSASTTFYSSQSDPTTGVVTSTVSTNASNDAWLRTDGSNQMQANLDFDPAAANRDINDADTINGDTLNLSTEANAPIYRDSDDPANYFVNPDSGSRISQLEIADGTLTLSDPAGTDISTDSGQDLRLNAASGDVVVGGSGGSGLIDIDDAVVRSRGNQRLSDLLPKYSHKQTYYVSHNSTVTKPACPGGGTPKILIDTLLNYQRRDVTGAYSTLFTGASSISATQWRVQIGTHRNGFIGVGYGLAKTFCYYP